MTSTTDTIFDRIRAEIADASEAEIIAEINYEILNLDGDRRLAHPEDWVLANMVRGGMPIEHDIYNETPASIAEEWVNGDFEPESKRAELEADADAALDRIAAHAIAEILVARDDAE